MSECRTPDLSTRDGEHPGTELTSILKLIIICPGASTSEDTYLVIAVPLSKPLGRKIGCPTFTRGPRLDPSFVPRSGRRSPGPDAGDGDECRTPDLSTRDAEHPGTELTSYVPDCSNYHYSMDGPVGFLRFGEGTFATYGPGSSRIVKFQWNLKLLGVLAERYENACRVEQMPGRAQTCRTT